MPHFILLCLQVFFVVRIRPHRNIYVLNNFKPVTNKSSPFFRVVGHEFNFSEHPGHAEFVPQRHNPFRRL